MANLTSEQIQNLNLGIAPLDARTVVTINAALEFMEENTTINVNDLENLPSCAKLFMMKYAEISNMRTGVVSESIEGLSQSFASGSQTNLIWDVANDLLGSHMKSRVRFVTAERKWK